MIEYLRGRLIEKNPAFAVLECNGIGYYVNISVNTYESMGSEELTKLYIHRPHET